MTSWHYSVLFLLLLSQTGRGEDDEDDLLNLIRNVTNTGASQVTDTTTEPHSVANSVNSFGYKLITHMMKNNEDKNVIISPTGISGLLAMTLLGSVGRSYDELADTLGFSRDVRKNRKYHEEFGDLLRSLNGNGTSKTMYADAVLVDTHATLRQAYRQFLSSVYNGEALSVDFADRTVATMFVNKWVSDHTNGKIEDFLKQPLPADTRAVLLSALYFSGQWQMPFAPEYTQKMPFKKPGNDVMADLMLNFGDFNYTHSREHDLKMVAFSYNDSVTNLYVLKPRHPKNTSLSDLLSRLDSEKIDKIIDELKVSKCVIRFPRMVLQGSANLEHSLQALGIKTLFQPNLANFALMLDANATANKTENDILARINADSTGVNDLTQTLNSLPNPGVHIDSIIHDVRININEFGTEAVAATAGVLARTAELFYVDSPFYMFIRNEQTKLVTFSAVINDPTA